MLFRSLGTLDGGMLDMKHLHWLAQSARTLIVECWRAVVAGRHPHLLAMSDGLRARGWETRHNEPYAGVPEGLTSWLRGQLAPERYVGIEIEASQAWVDDPGRSARSAADLAELVKSLPPA